MRAVLFFIIAVLFLSISHPVEAKLLPRFAGKKTTTSTKATGSNVTVSPKFMSGKTGVKVNFSNLAAANTVSYVLSYDTGGKPEGIAGSVNVADGTSSRDLVFGTCSSGSCVYHKNIKNCVLTVTSKLKSGKTSKKVFRLKV